MSRFGRWALYQRQAERRVKLSAMNDEQLADVVSSFASEVFARGGVVSVVWFG